MSRKKTSTIDKNLFANNISILAERHGGKKALSEKIGIAYDTIRRWCLGEFLPESNQLLIIHETIGISIDWLLTGTTESPPSNIAEARPSWNFMEPEDFMCGWTEEEIRACHQVKKILESNHPVVKPALISNLAAFEYTIQKDEDFKKLKGEVDYLKKIHKKGKLTGTD